MIQSSSQEIGQRLERVRRIEGLSQGKFCEALGISRTSLQNYTRGDRDLPLPVLAVLLEKFATDPIWLMYGDESNVSMRHKSSLLAEIRGIGIALEERAAQRGIVLSGEERWRLVSQIYTALLMNGNADQKALPNDFILDQMLENNGHK
ncbi:MAG: helix-turn-helix transcriptional regulator [Shimia thalassica]|uniref:helix-turn-helix domain-containing protein n=1 Tax=Alphaproteobacteria TaxID=28211 RepID=UPI003298A3AD